MQKPELTRLEFFKSTFPALYGAINPEKTKFSEKEILKDFEKTCKLSMSGSSFVTQKPEFLTDDSRFSLTKDKFDTEISVPLKWRDRNYNTEHFSIARYFFKRYPYNPRIIPLFQTDFHKYYENSFSVSSNIITLDSNYRKEELFKLKTNEAISLGIIEITWLGISRLYTDPSNKSFTFSLGENKKNKSTQTVESPYSTLFLPTDLEILSTAPNSDYSPKERSA